MKENIIHMLIWYQHEWTRILICRKGSPEALIKKYFQQLTSGCEKPLFNNRYCVSAGHVALSSNEAASILLHMEVKLFTRYPLLFTRYSLLFTRYSLLFTCYSLHFTRYSLHCNRYLLLFTRYWLLFTRYFLLGTLWYLLVTRCYLLGTYYILFLQHCIIFTMFTLYYASVPEKENTNPIRCFSSVGRYRLIWCRFDCI